MANSEASIDEGVADLLESQLKLQGHGLDGRAGHGVMVARRYMGAYGWAYDKQPSR
jgi:hypothetical protein